MLSSPKDEQCYITSNKLFSGRWTPSKLHFRRILLRKMGYLSYHKNRNNLIPLGNSQMWKGISIQKNQKGHTYSFEYVIILYKKPLRGLDTPYYKKIFVQKNPTRHCIFSTTFPGVPFKTNWPIVTQKGPNLAWPIPSFHFVIHNEGRRGRGFGRLTREGEVMEESIHDLRGC